MGVEAAAIFRSIEILIDEIIAGVESARLVIHA
jgi:hypothetical protein